MAGVLLLLLVSSYGYKPVFAQEQNVRKLTLEEALKLAKTNNHQVQIAREQLSQAKGQSLEAWNGFLPKVVVSETFVRSNDPVAVFGAKLRQGVFGISDFGGPAASSAFPIDPALPNLNDPSEINNFNTAIEVQQPILNFDAILGKTAASAAVSGREYGVKRAEEAISLGVEKVYFGITLAKDKVNAIDQALKSINAYYNEAKAAFGKGLINEADLLSVQVRQAAESLAKGGESFWGIVSQFAVHQYASFVRISPVPQAVCAACAGAAAIAACIAAAIVLHRPARSGSG
ncbi:MAG: TolC family protein, partial [Chlorobiales bacterium]|nr:TolC family protein [Chlorobiales bacterium]